MFVLTVNGDTSIVVTGTSLDGCTDQDTIRFSQYQFDQEVNIPELVCADQETQITIGSAAGRPYTYQWGPEDCIVSGSNTATPIIDVAIAKSLFVTITDSNTGCVDSFSYPISIYRSR